MEFTIGVWVGIATIGLVAIAYFLVTGYANNNLVHRRDFFEYQQYANKMNDLSSRCWKEQYDRDDNQDLLINDINVRVTKLEERFDESLVSSRIKSDEGIPLYPIGQGEDRKVQRS